MPANALHPDAAGRSKPERLRLAIEIFYARSSRQMHPDGDWQEGLWYPSPAERRTCCEGIHPTMSNRQALESHCRSQSHIAALCDVPLGELKAAVRADRKQGSPIAEQVTASLVAPRPQRAETFFEMRQKARQETFEQLHAALAHGLPLFERLHALRDPKVAEEESMAPLLETASASAERLVATLHSARSLEATLTFGSALVETLRALLEEPPAKRRRSLAAGITGIDPNPDPAAPGRAA
ncbi:MAG: hypothetical protein ABJC13_09160 [Acidobacteriota bacterium]